MTHNTPLAETLRKRQDFLSLRKGIRQSDRLFTLQARLRGPSEAASPAPRIGFTVTRKVGGAVVRNRIKRRLRAAARLCAVEGVFRPGCDYALIARRSALNASFDELVSRLAATATKTSHSIGELTRVRTH